jgi:hypothetical protein
MSTRWSKWWWLRFYLIPTWSADERRAAGVFCGTFLTTFLCAGPLFTFYISRLKFDLNVTLTASVAISLWATIPSVRGMTTYFFPVTVKRGDEAAAKRLGGTAVVPAQSPGLWWIDFHASRNFSRGERFTKLVIFLIAMLIFCPSALYFPPHLMDWFDVSKRTSILATMVTMLPLSFFIGRKLSTWIWPDVVRRADENAFARFNHRKLTPQD